MTTGSPQTMRQRGSVPGPMVLTMHTPHIGPVLALVLMGASCGSADPGAGTSTSAGGTGSSGAATDAPPTTGLAPTDTGASTQGGPDGTSTGATSEPGSTGGTTAAGSTSSGSGGTSTGDGGSTDASTGGAGSDSTGGAVPVAYFDCTELTVVELALKEKISGAFDAQGVPLAVVATMVQGGAIDFQAPVAAPVAADDPYAADVAFWEQELTAEGWDVNPPGDPGGDRRYIFIPEGAQFVAKFALFYYRVYEGGGNGQFEFECLKQ